ARLGVHVERAADRQAEDELATLARLAADQDVAAVLAQDFAAHGKAQAGAPRPLRAHERLEDVVELLRRDADAVVHDLDAHPAGTRVDTGGNGYLRAGAIRDRVQGVADDVQQRPEIGRA